MKKLILIPILFIGCCVISQNKLLSKEDIHYFKMVVSDSAQKPLITMGKEGDIKVYGDTLKALKVLLKYFIINNKSETKIIYSKVKK